MSKKTNLRKIYTAQFYIQLTVACLFWYNATIEGNRIKMGIALLLMASWTLGYIRHRIVRGRLVKDNE